MPKCVRQEKPNRKCRWLLRSKTSPKENSSMSRTTHSIRNLQYAMVFQVLDVVNKIATRTVMVYVLGNAIIGLNGLFTEVLAVLSLAEMGVSAAINYSLYAPLARGDTDKIGQLMLLFRRMYQIIALCVGAVGLALLPFVHLLVRDVPYSIGYIRTVYLLFLCSTTTSYLFSYKGTLINADQMTYRITRIKMIMNTLNAVLKIVVILCFQSFLLFLLVDILMQIWRNIEIDRCATHHYPYLRQKAVLPDKEERRLVFRDIRHLFVGRLCGKITSSTDNILISTMDSTLSVGFYSNYAMIINNARTFMLLVVQATSGSIGNQMVTDTDHAYCTLSRLTMLMFLIANIVCTLFATQLTPLIGLWLGSSNQLADAVVVVLLINLFFYAVREPLWQFLAVSGLFQKDKRIAVLGTIVNLIISIGLGLKWGMLGIFIGTTATLLIQFVLKAKLLITEKFERTAWSYIALSFGYFGVTIVSSMVSRWLCVQCATHILWVDILLGALLSTLVAIGLSALCFARSEAFQYCISLLCRRLKKIAKLGKGGKSQ